MIVGFGGYPSFPPVFAGMILRKPVLIHEQNAVLGRANRLAALLGASLATSFNKTAKVPWGAGLRLRKTGNPLRPEVIEAARGGYRYLAKSRPFDLLIFGGSQGAKIFSKVVRQRLPICRLKTANACGLSIRCKSRIWPMC